MNDQLFPLFPLALLPLPSELVPLHIFEPKYRQLLRDMEAHDVLFGIYFDHELNEERIGSLMKLESIIKRYPDGEADIIVRCVDNFKLKNFHDHYKSSMYPGGEIQVWNTDINTFPDEDLYDRFIQYLVQKNIRNHIMVHTLYQIATELNLEIQDRYRFLTLKPEKQNAFLRNHISFQLHLLEQEEKSKHVYFLN